MSLWRNVALACVVGLTFGCKKEPAGTDPGTGAEAKKDEKKDEKAEAKKDEKAEAKKDEKKDEKAEAKKDEKKDEAASDGIDKGNKELATAVKAVMTNCEVSEWGYIRTCKDGDAAKKALETQEKTVGVKQALLTYCHAQGDKNQLVRGLATTRMSILSFSRTMSEEADEKVYECLVEALNKDMRSRHARTLARAATYMGTALKKEDSLLKIIDASDQAELKQAVYGSLWANGRIRVFEKLEKLLKESTDLNTKDEVIRGFGMGNPLAAEEKTKVCELLVPYMTNDELRLASSAAYRVAYSCELQDKVLDAAQAMLKQNKFDTTYVGALQGVVGFFGNKATPKQKKRVLAQLGTVMKNKGVSDITRSSALSAINNIDKKAGTTLAKKYAKDPNQFVRSAAERILNAPPAPR